MNDAAEVLVVVAGSGTVVVTGMSAFTVHRMRVRNRVSPTRRSPAPLSWLVSTAVAARLHRRLRASVASARLAVSLPAEASMGLGDVVDELETRATELDRQLVVAARAARRPRNRMLRELGAEVREVEALNERVVRMARAWSGATPSERGLAPLRERLDLLEVALAELDGIAQLPERVLDAEQQREGSDVKRLPPQT